MLGKNFDDILLTQNETRAPVRRTNFIASFLFTKYIKGQSFTRPVLLLIGL